MDPAYTTAGEDVGIRQSAELRPTAESPERPIACDRSTDRCRSTPGPCSAQDRTRPLYPVRTLVIAIAAFLLLDAAIFRTPLYPSFLSPNSNAGRVQAVLNAEAKGARAVLYGGEHREVIFLGDSRVAEGFSPMLADRMVDGTAITFTNAAVPGSSLRTQAYLLRSLDPDRNRYAMVVLGLPDFDDAADPEDMTDRLFDLRFTAPLLRYDDVLTFPLTFRTTPARGQAFVACVLKGLSYQQDVQDFLVDPRKRLEEVARQKRGAAQWRYQYPYSGRGESLRGLTYDRAAAAFSFPPAASASQRASLDAAKALASAPSHSNAGYRREWLGELLRRYADRLTRIVVVRMPRGPVAFRDSRPTAESVVGQFAAAGKLTALADETFNFLERPEFYFDALHLNADGRREFTKKFVREVAPLLGVNTVGTLGWAVAGPSSLRLQLEDAVQSTETNGIYAPAGGISFVGPEASLPLPEGAPAGDLVIEGHLPDLLDRLLPLTVTVTTRGMGAPGPEGGNVGATVVNVVKQAGLFQIHFPVSGPSRSGRPLRLFIGADKSLVPREVGINGDERRLSWGLVKVDYVFGAVPPVKGAAGQ